MASSSSAIRDVLLGPELEHRLRRRLQTFGQKNEIDVYTDRHGSERKIEEVAKHHQPRNDGDRHRHGADIKDRWYGRSERHPDREDDDQRGKQEDMR